jgi:hypothetical protein
MRGREAGGEIWKKVQGGDHLGQVATGARLTSQCLCVLLMPIKIHIYSGGASARIKRGLNIAYNIVEGANEWYYVKFGLNSLKY